MKSRKKKINKRLLVKRKLSAKQKSSKPKALDQKNALEENIPPKRRKISKRRLWLFRIITAIVVPVLLFFLIECFLRVAGFGYSTDAIIKYKFNGSDVYCNNLKFGWLFFPKYISRELDDFIIQTAKPRQTYRIFILGASAAYGEPDSGYSFGRILKLMLEEQYEGFDFEVIILGMTAINSHAVLKIAKDCAKYQPDLFVVYLGNNEVVGPYGPGTVFSSFSSSLSAIRASIAVKSSRLGQLLQNPLNFFNQKKNKHRTWLGMSMFLENQVRFDSPDLNYVYKHFERNLSDICKVGRKANAKVILCNVSCNLKDCPPFASQHRLDITRAEEKKWNDLYQKAVTLESEKKYAEALKYYLSIDQIDDHFADLHFRIGKCYQEIGDYENARNRYFKARDLDTLRFRPDKKINGIIRSVAEGKAQKGIYFVDTISAFENNSPNKIPGKEFFYEHVHFTFQGNYLLARTVFEQVEKILPPQIIQAKNNRTILTEQDCIERLALTGWDQQRLVKLMLDFISKPPFTHQLYHEERVNEMEEQIEHLSQYTLPELLQESAFMYKKAIAQYPTDWKLIFRYAEFLLDGLKNENEAISQYRIIIQQIPFYTAYNTLGMLLSEKGNLDEAIEIYYKGIERKATGEKQHFNLALALEKKGDYKGAIKHCSKSLEINPQLTVLAYHLLARVLIICEEYDQAIQVLRKSIEFYPDNAHSHFGLGTLYIDKGEINQAINELNLVLELEPEHKLARELLEKQKSNNK